jgi:hypothetical protein
MSLKMPITKLKIHNHFHYSLWKYALLAVIALFGWNLIYTSTRYQSPENLKVEFYAEESSLSGTDPQVLADQIHTDVMPEMEEVTTTATTYDDTYGDMQLMVWVSAAQGDVYLLSNSRYQSLADNQALLDLQPYVDSGALQTQGLTLTDGYVTDSETGLTTLVGIPADGLQGLADYGLLCDNATLCILANNGNDEYAVKFLNYLLTHLQTGEATDATASAPLPTSEATK